MASVDRPTLTIVVLDEIRTCREAIAALLDRDREFRVIASPPDSRSLANVVASAPSVVVLNASQRVGVDAIHQVRARIPEARVVAFGISEPDKTILDFARQGAIVVAGNDAAAEELVRLVRALAGDPDEDELSCAIQIMATLLLPGRESSASYLAARVPEALTPRERAVLTLVASGQSNKQIAAELHLTVATVKTHVHHVLAKAHAGRRSELVARFAKAS